MSLYIKVLAILFLGVIFIAEDAFTGDWCGGRGRSWEAQVSTTIAVDNYGLLGVGCVGTRATFWKACKAHDECYWRLGSDRGQCDKEFKSKLLDECKAAFHGGGYVLCLKDCEAAAETYAAFVRAGGKESYENAQKEAKDIINILAGMAIHDSQDIREKISVLCPQHNDREGKCKLGVVAKIIQEEFDLILEMKIISESRVYEAKNSITAGSFRITSSGNVTFRAGNSIRLMSDFRVQNGSKFRAKIDPKLAQ